MVHSCTCGVSSGCSFKMVRKKPLAFSTLTPASIYRLGSARFGGSFHLGKSISNSLLMVERTTGLLTLENPGSLWSVIASKGAG